MQTDSRALLLNLAAAWSWIDFWNDKLSNIKNHTYACIFSGAQIYNRVLLEILKTHPTTPLVLEHFSQGMNTILKRSMTPFLIIQI